MAKPATAKTVAVPNDSIVRLSPEAPGDGFVAMTAVREGDTRAGGLNWEIVLADGDKAVAEARLFPPWIPEAPPLPPSNASQRRLAAMMAATTPKLHQTECRDAVRVVVTVRSN
jgi:hypothetical protein